MPSEPTASTPPADPVGVVDRETVLAARGWSEAFATAEPAEEPARALAAVGPGARVEVFLGTWCGDSRREVARFFRALDVAGEVPFEVELIGVDRSKRTPDGRTEGRDIRFVPTFIVSRDGTELGRIVESAPDGVERDLLSLLDGSRTGTISGRTDL